MAGQYDMYSTGSSEFWKFRTRIEADRGAPGGQAQHIFQNRRFAFKPSQKNMLGHQLHQSGPPTPLTQRRHYTECQPFAVRVSTAFPAPRVSTARAWSSSEQPPPSRLSSVGTPAKALAKVRRLSSPAPACCQLCTGRLKHSSGRNSNRSIISEFQRRLVCSRRCISHRHHRVAAPQDRHARSH